MITKTEEILTREKVEQIVNSTNDFIEKMLEKVKKYQTPQKLEFSDEVVEIPFEEFKHSLIQKLELEEEKCIICANALLSRRTLSCGHVFCSKCAKRLRSFSNCCPICRRSMILLS